MNSLYPQVASGIVQYSPLFFDRMSKHARRIDVLDLNRRKLLLAGTATVIGSSIPAFSATSPTPLRRECRSSAAAQDMATLVQGLKLLGQAPADAGNPSSRAFWEWFHANRAWHHNDHIWPWHAALILSFEAVIRRLTGNQNFRMPYWNPTLNNRVIPPAFRDKSLVLYDPRRASALNNGGSLPASAVQWNQAKTLTLFNTADPNTPNFGGRISGSNLDGPGAGSLEAAIHALLHIAVSGDMGDLATAARDLALFLAHHCNLQRLVRSWRNWGNSYDTSPTWLKFVFTPFPNFVDGRDGVKYSIEDILFFDHEVNYDVLEPLPDALAQSQTAMASRSAKVAPQPPLLLGSVQNLALTNQRQTVVIPLSGMPSGNTVNVSIQGEVPGLFYYDVYLGPNGMRLNPSGPYFLGGFGSLHHDQHPSTTQTVWNTSANNLGQNSARLVFVATQTIHPMPMSSIGKLQIWG